MKKAKKRNPRSEAAQREALKKLYYSSVRIAWLEGGEDYEIYIKEDEEVVAIFDLRDCYRKRKPLTGITKKLRSAIQPRRKRK